MLVEAMASGLPVIAADVPQSREVLAGAGELSSAGDAAALAAGLRRLAADPAGRLRHAWAGLAIARSLDWSIFDALFHDYLSVLRADTGVPLGARSGACAAARVALP